MNKHGQYFVSLPPENFRKASNFQEYIDREYFNISIGQNFVSLPPENIRKTNNFRGLDRER